MKLTLEQVAQATGGKISGGNPLITRITTDSRATRPGDLFVALSGERFDGHEFVGQALSGGAVAAMVNSDKAETISAPLVAVADSRRGLGELAASWRRQFNLPLIAVTGSNGKTTVKEMLASICREAAGEAAVLATEGNLNNDIGVPQMLFRLEPQHRYAVIEMGMNHLGEIDYLTHMAEPTVALVNNAHSAHLAGLGDVATVARAKGEIFGGLKADGVAVINADDAYADLWRGLAGNRRIIDFGLQTGAAVHASYNLDSSGSDVEITTPVGKLTARLSVPGLHNVKNALAATAGAVAMGLELETIAAGLSAWSGVKGRLQRKAGCCGVQVIDDTYNANPASVRAAIDVLAAQPGEKIMVLGDMGELGEHAEAMHGEIGTYAREQGLERLWTVGEMSRATVESFGAGAVHYGDLAALCKALDEVAGDNLTVLVKGSRFMRMERVVEHLVGKDKQTCC